MARSPLAQRVITALVAVAVLLPAFLFLPKGFGDVLVTAFVLAAAWEWAAFCGWQRPAQRMVYVVAVGIALAASSFAVTARAPVDAIAAISMLWWAAAFVLILRFPVAIGRVPAALAGLAVMVPAWSCLVLLLGTPVGGRRLLLVLLAVVWAADVGAYFAGRRFGRVKLAPRVSPGKTWEGVLGGLASSALAAMAGAVVMEQAALPAISLGLAVGAVSIVGDLTVSVFKRNAGLKDSGNLFPGHGGVLDRVDSVTAAAPLFVLLAGWLGWIGS